MRPIPPQPTPPQPPVPPEPDWLEIAIRCLQLTPDAPRVLQVHVPMSTILDLDHRSGHVEGIGPVPAQRIRDLVPVTALQRIYVDHLTGMPLGIDPQLHQPHPPSRSQRQRTQGPPPHVTEPPPPPPAPTRVRPETAPSAAENDQNPQQNPQQHPSREQRRLLALLTPARITDTIEAQHDPSSALGRLVDLRDRYCSGPGCTQPASRCHRDHEREWPDGPTAEWNLNNKSARCHRLKHHGFTVHRDPHTGASRWTSPNGTTYDTPSPWRPPNPLPDGLTLPEPTTPAAPDPDHEPNRPLWPTVWIPKRTQRTHKTAVPKTEPRQAAQDDGPPF